MPTKARPPVSAESVAAAFAVTPAGRNVTGVHSVPRSSPVPSPATAPRVTQGSGIGSQARPTWGIWIRWSITASPANPASSAAPATSPSQRRGSSPHGNRDTWSTIRRPRLDVRSSPAGAGTGRRRLGRGRSSLSATATTRSQPSSSSSGRRSRTASAGPRARAPAPARPARRCAAGTRRRASPAAPPPPAARPPGAGRASRCGVRRRGPACRRRS